MKKKEEIAFRLTKENQQEVYELLKLFDEPMYYSTREDFEDNVYDESFIYLCLDDDGVWLKYSQLGNRTEVTFEEFRDILFYEHLEKGDIVTAVDSDTNDEWIIVVKGVEESKLLAVEALSPTSLWDGDNEWFWKDEFNILRYSTKDELEKLEQAKRKVSKKGEVAAWVPEEGELVELSWQNNVWFRGEFCVDLGDKYQRRYVAKKVNDVFICAYPYMRQVKVTVTKQEIADWKGVDVNQIEIVDNGN